MKKTRKSGAIYMECDWKAVHTRGITYTACNKPKAPIIIPKSRITHVRDAYNEAIGLGMSHDEILKLIESEVIARYQKDEVQKWFEQIKREFENKWKKLNP